MNQTNYITEQSTKNNMEEKKYGDVIQIRISSKLKKQIIQHAEMKYGLELSAYLRYLAIQDMNNFKK